MANPPNQPPPPPPPAPPKPNPPPATTPAGSGKPTSGKKAIITASLWPPDWQRAESSGKKLPYFVKDAAGEKMMDDNHVETWKAIPTETCTHTYVRKFLIVHDKTLIGHDKGAGPSWYASNLEKLGAPPHGVGVNNKGKVQFYAQAVGKSKDVKVEGNWLVREGDATKQDADNGAGKFVYAVGRTEVPDDWDLIFMQCSVSKLRLECKHPEPEEEEEEAAGAANKAPAAEKRFVVVDPADPKSQNVFEVFIGDEVTVWATRINAAETDEAKQKKPFCDFKVYKEQRKPPPEEKSHAAFLVSRNKGLGIPFVCDGWDLKENVTLCGKDEPEPGDTTKPPWTATKIVLKADWLLEEYKTLADELTGGDLSAGEPGDAATEFATADARGTAGELVRSRRAAGAARRRAVTNNSDVAAGAVVSANQRVDRATAAHETSKTNLKGMKAINTVGKSVYTLFSTYKGVASFLNWDPLTITLKASGCSKGPTAIIKAYPKGAAEVDLWALADLPFKTGVEAVKSAVDSFKTFLKYIKGSKVVGRGTPNEPGTPDDATTASLGGITIGVYFFRGQRKRSNDGKGVDKEARELDDMEPTLKLCAEWKELEKDVPEDKLGTWMVNRAFSLEIGVEKLVGLFLTAEVALLKLSFIGIVTEVLDFFGVKVGPFLSFDIALSVGVAASFGRNEYGEWLSEVVTVPANAKVALTLFIKAGSVAEIGARVTGTWKATYVVRKNEKSKQICLESDDGEYEVKSELYAKIDLGIWSGEYAKEFYKWSGATSPTSWSFMDFK